MSTIAKTLQEYERDFNNGVPLTSLRKGPTVGNIGSTYSEIIETERFKLSDVVDLPTLTGGIGPGHNMHTEFTDEMADDMEQMHGSTIPDPRKLMWRVMKQIILDPQYHLLYHNVKGRYVAIKGIKNGIIHSDIPTMFSREFLSETKSFDENICGLEIKPNLLILKELILEILKILMARKAYKKL